MGIEKYGLLAFSSSRNVAGLLDASAFSTFGYLSMTRSHSRIKFIAGGFCAHVAR